MRVWVSLSGLVLSPRGSHFLAIDGDERITLDLVEIFGKQKQELEVSGP